MKQLIFLMALLSIGLFAEAFYLMLRDKASEREKAITESLQALRAGTAKKPGGGILRVTLLSKNPTIHNLLAKLPFTWAMDRWLENAQVRMLLDRFLLFVTLSCAVCAVVALSLTNSLLVCLVGWMVGGLIPWFYVIYLKKRRMNQISEQLPEALDSIVRSLKAGHALSAAFEVVAKELPPPISTEFAKIRDETNLGVSMKDSLEGLLHRCDNEDLKLFVTSILIQWEVGGNLTEILNNLSHTIRERFKLRGQIKALTAEGRLSGWVLGLMPAFVGGVIYYLNPTYLEPLFTTSMGKILLFMAVALVVLGAITIKKIITIEI
jgi:tight adherence protein B